MIAAILAIIVSSIAYFAMRGTKRGAEIMLISMAAGYVVLSLFNGTIGTFTYALPLLIAVLAYLNLRYIVIGNVIVLVANVIRLIIQYDPQNQALLQSNVIGQTKLSEKGQLLSRN